MVPAAGKGEFFTDGRRSALSEWALNVSVLFVTAGVLSEAFSGLPFALKVAVIVAGLVFMGLGVFVAPDKSRGD